jgi:hypothetical protein
MAILCPASLGGNEVASSDMPARTCQAYGLTDAEIQSAKSCLLLCGAREQHRRHRHRGGGHVTRFRPLWSLAEPIVLRLPAMVGHPHREAGHANTATSE